MARKRLRRVLPVVAALAIGATSLAVTLPGNAIGEPDGKRGKTGETGKAVEPDVPKLEWTSCNVVYQCAKAKVPLDYDDPGGSTIELALIRKPSTAPDQRIGSLFVNPGGPGGANTDLVSFAAITNSLGGKVGATFDIVGVDPRGTGGSVPATCPESPDIEPVPAPPEVYPTEGQYDQHFAYDDYLRRTCAKTGGEILDHMSIADTARDMDLIRQAVGDEKLNYYGLSYGSVLGHTYAALFPDRIRTMAMDAVLDPVPWATGDLPPFVRVETGKTTSELLLTAFERCDRAGITGCALAGHAKDRWQRVRESLDKEPLNLGGTVLDDKNFVMNTQSAFQLDHLSGVPAPTIPLWMGVVRGIDTLRFGPSAAKASKAEKNALLDRLDVLFERFEQAKAKAPGGKGAEQGNEDVTGGNAKVHGVWCTDTESPTDRQTWIDAAEASDVAGLGVGPPHAWAMSICADWPRSADDAYRGPFGGELPTPPLIVGLTHDTVTGLSGVRSAAARYPGAKVVEVETWGHTSLGKSNGCLRPLFEAYLIDQQLPAADQVCKPDEGLFGLAP